MIDFKQLAKEHAKILINKENELMINEKILKDRVRKLLKEYMDNPEFDMPQSYYDQYSAPIDKIRSRQMSNAFKPNDTTSDEFAMDWFNSEPQDEVLTEENPTQPFEIGQDVLVWGTKSNRWFDAVIKRIDDGSAMVFVPKVQQMLSAPFDAIKSRKMNITGLSDQDVQSRYDRIKDELTLDEEDLSLMENVIRKIAKSEYKRMIKEYTDEQKKKA